MKTKDPKESIDREISHGRDDRHKKTKQQTYRSQEKDRKMYLPYSPRRHPPRSYQVNDTFAIKRTQFDPGIKRKPNETYDA